ncbi:fluoride efflux transporter CrcB [Chryseomicrobium excrementi]|uniref:Fluoride-specific ion channel FluC n=1 Tax=Chryseomicrobium excrementi TaxID=2041346 RepID=A0A2M9F1Q0_9BACL|nr:CrcB family protein [Chryseomicrobium excrementi]PJK17383.1 fluoride efflux transporter CrcB [Chryseomicrobium excrementi]
MREVMIGGALGAVFRALFATLLPLSLWGLPLATLLANWVGSAAIGYVSLLALSPGWKRFWMTGIFGGFTTMSLFSFESLTLIQEGNLLGWILYSFLTLVGSTVIVRWIRLKGAVA